jgi:hypothetical protein
MKSYREIITPVIPLALEKGYSVKSGVVVLNGERVSAGGLLLVIEEAGLPVNDYKGRLKAVLASDQLRNGLPNARAMTPGDIETPLK